MDDYKPIIPAYDFTEARGLTPLQRLMHAVNTVQVRNLNPLISLYKDLSLIPPFGATDAEVDALEQRIGVSLSSEYRLLLNHCRYLQLGVGLSIWGLNYEGISIGSPWVLQNLTPGRSYLVIGDFCRYGDGDQVMIDLSDDKQSVIVYLHEEETKVHFFAPSLSLAIWRMVTE